MFFLLVLVCLSKPTEAAKYEVVSVEKRVSLKTDSEYLVAPTAAFYEDGKIFFIDNKDLRVWKYDGANENFFYFSGRGEGPGELRELVLGFYSIGDRVTVLNASGNRKDVFSIVDGELLSSAQTRGSTLYLEGTNRVFKKGSYYVLEKDGVEKAKEEAFKMQTYGVQVHTALFKNRYFLIGTTMSNNNTVGYIIFDLVGDKVSSKGILEKKQKITLDTVPEKMRKELSGMDLDLLFFNNFQVLLAEKEYGFLVQEYGMGLYKSSERGYYSTVHTINPEKSTASEITLYHKDIKNVSFVIPRKTDTWILYEAGVSNICFLKVRPLP